MALHLLNDRQKAIAALLCCAVLWSFSGVIVKLVQWHPMAIMGVRSLIAALFILVAMGRKPKFNASVPQIGAAVTYALTVALYIPAIKMTTAANAILLQYTAPIWVALFGAWFLGERCAKRDGISIAISMLGMVLFFYDDLDATALTGNLLALGSGVTIAAMMVFLRGQKHGAPLESVILGNLLAFLISLPWLFTQPLPTPVTWLGLLLMGMFQLGLSYILFCYGVRRVTAIQSVLFSMLEPILNPIWVLLLVGERPRGWALMGGILVVGAVTARGIMLALDAGDASDSAEQSVQSALSD